MIVICGMSAWEYYCTPPAVRDIELPEKIATVSPPIGAGLPHSLLFPRKNACEASALISKRLLFDLKGLSLPINVFAEEGSNYRANKLIAPHRKPSWLPYDELIKLGSDLYITSPQLTLLHLARTVSWQQLSLLMLEACGLFAIFRGTLRSAAILNGIKEHYGARSQSLPFIPAIAEFCDENGNLLHQTNPCSPVETWTPCFDRFGKMTEIWKRPPLCSTKDLEDIIRSASRMNGLQNARTALAQTADGCGSPLEARLFLLLCASTTYGGEHWERPSLNRRVVFTKNAQKLSGQSHCACDLLWVDKKVAIEAKGKAFHADQNGFEIEHGRRAALESMGYTEFDVIYRQIADCNQFDALLHTFSKRLGFALQERTPLFLRRRKQLHDALFPYKWVQERNV
ncbi:hypothetical protein [uncultured Slackia sp.]|uniref:hypothetical protein n=1 Tax=uncultured Slackia sp. TaxID=665903 RepID=UPI0025F25C42|nr:hypothetical protein [uncultured Slackia sp.]